MSDIQVTIPDPTEAANNSSTEKSVTTNNPYVRSGRLDKYDPSAGVKNPFLRVFLKSIATSSLDAKAVIPAITIRTKNSPGFWEEGGYDDKNRGRVFIITDENGNKLTPLKTFPNSDIVNGQHALVEIAVGYHLVVGGTTGQGERKDGVCFIADYIISDIEESVSTVMVRGKEQEQSQYRVTIQCLRQACYSGGSVYWEQDDDAIKQYQPLDEKSPVWDVAYNRCWEREAKLPAYVKEYEEHSFYMSDYKACIENEDFMATCVEYKTLEEAYEVINKEVREIFARDYSKAQTNLITSFTYYPGVETIAAYIFICRRSYTGTPNGAAEPLKGYRVMINKDSGIRYIDGTELVTWDKAVEILTSGENCGCIANSLKRVSA